MSRLQCSFREHGFRLHGVDDLAAARPVLEQWQFDAVLCDADGSEARAVEAAVRALHREQRAPIVVLASAGSDEGLIAALEAGAATLIARAASARLIALKLQRLLDLAVGTANRPPRALSFGDLRLDPRRAEAAFRDRPLPLTGGEFELLLLLADRADGYVHRGTIMQTLGRARAGGEQRRSADMHVCRLRRKLREAGASSLALETIHGRGYALRLRDDAMREAAT